MPVSTDEILSRVAFLEESMARLHRQIVLATRFVEEDPAGAMCKVRVVHETIVTRAFERITGQAREGRSAASMINDGRFADQVPRRIITRMNSVRSMCNIPSHEDLLDPQALDDVQPADALAVLRHLCEVIEWYMASVERPREEERTEEQFVWDRETPRLELKVKLMGRFHYCAHERTMIREALEHRFGWGEKAVSLAFLAVNELVDNAFEHGCRGRGEKEVRIELEMEGDTLSATVSDEGDGFDLGKALTAEQERESPPKRGRGLLIVKHVASDLVAADDGRTVRVVLGRARLESRRQMALRGPPLLGKMRRTRWLIDTAGSRFGAVPVDEVFVDPAWPELLEHLRRRD